MGTDINAALRAGAGMTPLAIDLFCGLGGWTEGLLAEGWDVVGFDIERHVYGEHRYPAQLVVQDVLTLHGSQFRDAALIVASPPCQAYSYRAMPWKRAKALPPPDNTLFDACFRLQREASAAAGRHVPLIVENVRGAQKWVGRARWNYGSFYLWGDVPALMPLTHNRLKGGQTNWRDHDKPDYRGDQLQDHFKSVGCGENIAGIGWTGFANEGWRDHHRRKVSGGGANGWFGRNNKHALRQHSSGSSARKFASAMIAKIPLPLSRHIAAMYRPLP